MKNIQHYTHVYPHFLPRLKINLTEANITTMPNHSNQLVVSARSKQICPHQYVDKLQSVIMSCSKLFCCLFASIIESEIPSFKIRLATVVLSIFFAWLTYKFVEGPVRCNKYSNIKITTLVLLLIGTFGFSQTKVLYDQSLEAYKSKNYIQFLKLVAFQVVEV